MSVERVNLSEELRRERQRLSQIETRVLAASIKAFQTHALTRPGGRDGSLEGLSTLPVIGNAVSVLRWWQRLDEDHRAERLRLAYSQTVQWLSELEGTLNRHGNQISDGDAGAWRGTLRFAKLQIDALERGDLGLTKWK